MATVFAVLHVVAGVFIVGPMAILPMTGMRAIRAGNANAVLALAKSTNLFSLLSVVVAVLGFGLVGMSSAKDNYSVGTPWILASIVLYAVALGLSLFLVVPALRGAGEAMAADESMTKPALYSRVAAGSGLVAVLLVALVVLMVWRP